MADIRQYAVTITGTRPLLMHSDDVSWADTMDAWRNDPENKKLSRAGDDRTPAFRWIGALYHDDNVIAIPSENISTALREGGAQVPVPGGKGGKTFKSQSQSGMMMVEGHAPLVINGSQTVSVSDIQSLMSSNDFTHHMERARELGFELFVKRARVGTAKHIRVRPRFNVWQASFTLRVWDEQLTEPVLRDIFKYAGANKGIGDWRPGSKTPGAWGMFTASITPIKG